MYQVDLELNNLKISPLQGKGVTVKRVEGGEKCVKVTIFFIIQNCNCCNNCSDYVQHLHGCFLELLKKYSTFDLTFLLSRAIKMLFRTEYFTFENS